jgi:hypothetical protein
MKLAAEPATARALPCVDPRPAIDAAHLARMTMGEAGLEREVLTLFDRQAGLLLARMRGAPGPVIAAFAHTLKGSACGVGAWRVAEAAGAVETQAARPDGPEAAVARLAVAVDEAKAQIANLLAAHS